MTKQGLKIKIGINIRSRDSWQMARLPIFNVAAPGPIEIHLQKAGMTWGS
ncbi:MAG: hypothetical protein OHK0037_37790 [Elainellaceae cyanobacterium]